MAEAENYRDASVSIEISGIVQGVGFRPFVYTLASSLGMRGMVFNTARGVTIRAEGPAESIQEFIYRLRNDAPAAARIDSLAIEWPPSFEASMKVAEGDASPVAGAGAPQVDLTGGPVVAGGTFEGFSIDESIDTVDAFVFISPDMATCPECVAEMLDPGDRRHLYPFINCTNCGPRYSITLDVPYDRASTTMSKFEMCHECQKEYDDPGNRRFHAQPNACPDCGPSVTFVRAPGGIGGRDVGSDDGRQTDDDDGSGQSHENRGVRHGEGDGQGHHLRAGRDRGDAIKAAVDALAAGEIVAIKGLGGFHLACDAFNQRAVARLRERKRKSNKPFAIMAKDVDTIRRYALVSEGENRLLTSRERPIVLLDGAAAWTAAGRRPSPALAADVCRGNRQLGVMLPYTPVHELLFHDSPLSMLVMTSGNTTEEPIVTGNEEAILRLGKIADAFLMHDRDIHMRVDDSIVRHDGGRDIMIRRARGYAPVTLDLGSVGPPAIPAPSTPSVGDLTAPSDLFAAGAELKSTFCIVRDGRAIISQHLGDLQNAEASDFYLETYKNLSRSFRATPGTFVTDLHPEYLSTRLSEELATHAAAQTGDGGGRLTVQHHHAHIASCMAENEAAGELIGIAFDGAGIGDDGTIWGGEFLVCDYSRYRRAAHLRAVPLPGGDAAAREPWRMALSYLLSAFSDDEAAEHIQKLLCEGSLGNTVSSEELSTVTAMINKGINCPLTTSAGRLFDAVAAIVQSIARVTFEGEAAISLEQAADPTCTGRYNYSIEPSGSTSTIDMSPAIREILSDTFAGESPALVSAKFHNTIVNASAKMCQNIRDETGLNRVALSGGVFQNRLLSGRLEERLTADGFTVLTHAIVPANDGGISLGQAAIALAKSKEHSGGEYLEPVSAEL